MTGRHTALITGGTGSLGFRAAQVLADAGWDVLITGRSATGVASAATRLGEHATGLRLDLDSLDEVRRFAQDLPPLDAVVCNAGLVNVSGTKLTRDGIEQTFGVNHLAHFLLVREVLPRLVAPGRVVFISSTTHDPARKTGFPDARYTTARELAYPDAGPGPDAQPENPLVTGRRRYSTAKLCAVLAAYEFARRIPPEVATFNVYDPGETPGTDLIRDHGGFRAFAWRYVLPTLARLHVGGFNTPARAGAQMAGMVLVPALEGVTGTYVSGAHATRSSADSYDTRLADDLWTTSVELTTRTT